MQNITTIVEGKISNMLFDRFAVLFDGWSCGSTHYVGFFAKFPSDNYHDYRKVLLGLAPMEDNTAQDEEGNLNFPQFVLSIFDKHSSNVSAFIGENTSTTWHALSFLSAVSLDASDTVTIFPSRILSTIIGLYSTGYNHSCKTYRIKSPLPCSGRTLHFQRNFPTLHVGALHITFFTYCYD